MRVGYGSFELEHSARVSNDRAKDCDCQVLADRKQYHMNVFHNDSKYYIIVASACAPLRRTTGPLLPAELFISCLIVVASLYK